MRPRPPRYLSKDGASRRVEARLTPILSKQVQHISHMAGISRAKTIRALIRLGISTWLKTDKLPLRED